MCKNATIFLNATGQATLTPADVNNNSTDACGISTLTLSKTTFNCSNIGNNVVTLTLKDAANNTSSCTATVTVRDAIAPTAVCADLTVRLSQSGTVAVYPAVLGLAGSSTDNCAVYYVSPTLKVYNTSNLGPNNLVITIRDGALNLASCTSVITVLPYGGNNLQSPDNGANTLGGIMEDFDLSVFPNPTAGATTVAFNLPTEQSFALRVFDLSGRLVMERHGEGFEGENAIRLESGSLSQGLYILDFQSERLKAQKRLVVQN
jgi:hypothetical protein